MMQGMAQNTAFMPKTSNHASIIADPEVFASFYSKPFEKSALKALFCANFSLHEDTSQPIERFGWLYTFEDSSKTGINALIPPNTINESLSPIFPAGYSAARNCQSSSIAVFETEKGCLAGARPFSFASMGVHGSQTAPYVPGSDEPPLDDDDEGLE